MRSLRRSSKSERLSCGIRRGRLLGSSAVVHSDDARKDMPMNVLDIDLAFFLDPQDCPERQGRLVANQR